MTCCARSLYSRYLATLVAGTDPGNTPTSAEPCMETVPKVVCAFALRGTTNTDTSKTGSTADTRSA